MDEMENMTFVCYIQKTLKRFAFNFPIYRYFPEDIWAFDLSGQTHKRIIDLLLNKDSNQNSHVFQVISEFK